MKKVLVSALAACFLSGAATAATLSATSNVDNVSDFSIDFNDNGDGVLQLSEITSFSGMGAAGEVYDQVTAIATIAGISSGGDFWVFSNASRSDSFSVKNWSYDVTGVPLPASAPLALAGLLAFGWLRRRQA